jgi:hypothetical protein
MTLGKIIDWIGSNLGRIKTVGLLVVVALFFLSLARSGCDRSDMEELIEKVTGLNVQNDFLNRDIKARDSILIAKDERITSLQDSLHVSKGRLSQLNRVYVDLEEDYQSLSDSLETVPADTSYAFLTQEAYPYQGEMKYPFNEPQVKGIHLTFLEKLTLKDINGIMRDQIRELTFQTQVQDSVVVEYNASVELLKADTTDMRKIIDNKGQIIDAQDDHIKTQKRRKNIWQIIGGAVIVFLAAIVAAG